MSDTNLCVTCSTIVALLAIPACLLFAETPCCYVSEVQPSVLQCNYYVSDSPQQRQYQGADLVLFVSLHHVCGRRGRCFIQCGGVLGSSGDVRKASYVVAELVLLDFLLQ